MKRRNFLKLLSVASVAPLFVAGNTVPKKEEIYKEPHSDFVDGIFNIARYDRALTDKDITDIYNNNELVAHYPLANGEFSICLDLIDDDAQVCIASCVTDTIFFMGPKSFYSSGATYSEPITVTLRKPGFLPVQFTANGYLVATMIEDKYYY